MTDNPSPEKLFPNTEAHKEKGDWNPLWETFAELDPDFLEAYLPNTKRNCRSRPELRPS